MNEKTRTGFFYSQKFLEHRPSPSHPESPRRLNWILDHLRKSSLWQRLRVFEPEPANLEWIEKIHAPEYINRIRNVCLEGHLYVDCVDVEVSAESFEIAVLAAGAVLKAVDAVATKEIDNAFCAIRPPGHHALRSEAMGFCLFNNIAIAAKYAQSVHGLHKILIVDWDVHHGNGTQDAFYIDPTVFYFSTHQYPHYPGTGAATESGAGEGRGFTLNVPMPALSTDHDYRRAFEEQLVPAAEKFRPELVLISAGFDAHSNDPLSNIQLSEDCFGYLTETVKSIANQWAGGGIVSVLEGGYHPQGLPKSVAAHLQALMK